MNKQRVEAIQEMLIQAGDLNTLAERIDARLQEMEGCHVPLQTVEFLSETEKEHIRKCPKCFQKFRHSELFKRTGPDKPKGCQQEKYEKLCKCDELSGEIGELEGIYTDTADEVSRSIFLMAGKISELIRATNQLRGVK